MGNALRFWTDSLICSRGVLCLFVSVNAVVTLSRKLARQLHLPEVVHLQVRREMHEFDHLLLTISDVTAEAMTVPLPLPIRFFSTRTLTLFGVESLVT